MMQFHWPVSVALAIDGKNAAKRLGIEIEYQNCNQYFPRRKFLSRRVHKSQEKNTKWKMIDFDCNLILWFAICYLFVLFISWQFPIGRMNRRRKFQWKHVLFELLGWNQILCLCSITRFDRSLRSSILFRLSNFFSFFLAMFFLIWQ